MLIIKTLKLFLLIYAVEQAKKTINQYRDNEIMAYAIKNTIWTFLYALPTLSLLYVLVVI